MMEKNRVLVVVDPTTDEAQVCVVRGAWIAEKLELGLELLICDYNPYLAGDRFLDSNSLKQLRAQIVHHNRENLEAIAAPLRERGLNVTTSALWDTPLDDAIVRHVKRTSPLLVVKETHYHGKIGRNTIAQYRLEFSSLVPRTALVGQTNTMAC